MCQSPARRPRQRRRLQSARQAAHPSKLPLSTWTRVFLIAATRASQRSHHSSDTFQRWAETCCTSGRSYWRQPCHEQVNQAPAGINTRSSILSPCAGHAGVHADVRTRRERRTRSESAHAGSDGSLIPGEHYRSSFRVRSSGGSQRPSSIPRSSIRASRGRMLPTRVSTTRSETSVRASSGSPASRARILRSAPGAPITTTSDHIDRLARAACNLYRCEALT